MRDKPTPTQARILACLSDGQPHTYDELYALLDDELAGDTVLAAHISNIRKILPSGHDIVCVWRNRRRMYRHMKQLISMD